MASRKLELVYTEHRKDLCFQCFKVTEKVGDTYQFTINYSISKGQNFTILASLDYYSIFDLLPDGLAMLAQLSAFMESAEIGLQRKYADFTYTLPRLRYIHAKTNLSYILSAETREFSLRHASGSIFSTYRRNSIVGKLARVRGTDAGITKAFIKSDPIVRYWANVSFELPYGDEHHH